MPCADRESLRVPCDWRGEGAIEWTITTRGSADGFGKFDVWSRAVFNGRDWWGRADNLPDAEGVPCKSRDNAFLWITNDRADISG